MNTVDFKIVCPVCNDCLKKTTVVNNEEPILPKEGDVTICGTCVSLLEFDENLGPHPIDIKKLEPDVQDVVGMMMVQLKQLNQTRTLN